MLSEVDSSANIALSDVHCTETSFSILSRDSYDNTKEVEQIELLHFEDIQTHCSSEHSRQDIEDNNSQQNHIFSREFQTFIRYTNEDSQKSLHKIDTKATYREDSYDIRLKQKQNRHSAKYECCRDFLNDVL